MNFIDLLQQLFDYLVTQHHTMCCRPLAWALWDIGWLIAYPAS